MKHRKQPIEIDQDGNMNIQEILMNMGLDFRRCEASYRINGNQLILNIRHIKPEKEFEYYQLEQYKKYKEQEKRMRAFENELPYDENEKLDYDDDECDPRFLY